MNHAQISTAIAIAVISFSPPFWRGVGGVVAAQNIAINTTGAAGDGSSMLDLNTGNTFANPNGKGLLVPNVALTGTSSANPVTSPATSLLVYNTATVSDVTPGYYYWDGAAWVRFNTGGGGGSGWLLLGNGSTVDGTNFLGTTDNKPLNFRVNNTKAGRIETSNSLGNVFLGFRAGNASNTSGINTAIGSDALKNTTTGVGNVAFGVQALSTNIAGDYNTALGYNSLYSSNASNNTAVGTEALYNNTAAGNTAIGGWALRANTTGIYNTAMGYQALRNNGQACKNIAIGYEALYTQSYGALWSEYNNVAIGYHALYANQPTTGLNGLENIAIGNDAMPSNTTGYENTAIGHMAMYNNISGYENVGMGKYALYNNTGNRNTAVGRSALQINSTGTNNTAIGYNANANPGTITNATAIGNGATVTANNNMVFGNGSIVGWGFGVAPGAAAIRVGTNGTNGNNATLTLAGAWTAGSDSTRKHNIKNMSYGLSEVMKLRPVTYVWKGTNSRDIGFIAQEVKSILPEIVYGEEGSMTLSYSQITSVLTKAIQEQQGIIDNQQSAIDNLQIQLNAVNARILSTGKK